MSACMAVSSPNGFGTASPFTGSLFGNSSTSYSSRGSSFGTSSSGSALSSGAGAYASSSNGTSGDAGGTVPPGYSANSAQSNALTSYLQKNRLPLVGGQVMSNDSGSREVILYGFVATDFGRQDAADKARRYLADPNVAVINRIEVRPELLASGGNGAPSTPPSTGSSASGTYSTGGLGSVQSYESQAQQGQTGQYVQNQSGLSALAPLIGMMGLLSFGSGGVGMGYGGYPPTYGSPFGMPYGGSPYGTPYSPYGMAPYGSPYGGSPFGYGGGGGFTFP